MEIVRDILLVLHFIGLASLLGGFLVQMKYQTKRVEAAMWHGALTQLVTGLLLVGVAEMGDRDVDNVKITVKLVVALAVTALAIYGSRREEKVTAALVGSVAGLTVLNIAVAVLWR